MGSRVQTGLMGGAKHPRVVPLADFRSIFLIFLAMLMSLPGLHF